MKYIFATSFALAANAVAVADDYPESMEYEFDRSNYGRVPTGDFQHQVYDFNEWEAIWEQYDYEERIGTEAELMIALEALRESLMELDWDIDELDYCIEHNYEDIMENAEDIHDN